MTYIVQELREHHAAIGFDDKTETWLTAAADEIERLREELAEAGSEVWLWTARCHSAIGLLPDDMVIGEIQKAAKEAEAKIERLREALRFIVDETCEYAIINKLGDPEQQHSIKLARAALGEGKEWRILVDTSY